MTEQMADPDTPDWVRDAIFYQIFPDRFARSLSVPKPRHLDEWGSQPTYHGYQGGDLIGVTEHLDYLVELGVNAIYFTPIFQSASNHRYHTHDYEKVDPMLGGTPALRRMIDEAHSRNIRVVLDGVFNHASRGFFPFHDIMENGPDSAYLDWFTIKQFPLNAYDSDKSPNYQAWWGLPALPKFNIACEEVREFLWGVGRMWDAVMNYQFTRACIAFFIGESCDEGELKRTSLFPVGPSTAEAFRHNIERLLGVYHPNVSAVMLNLLGSHDMARFLGLARGDKSALRLATLFQMIYPGAPSIYYGDEIGMTGGHDPANRGAFPWHKPESWDRDLLHEFQRLIALRRARPALRRGTFQFLAASDCVIAVARQLDDETVLAIFNVAQAARRIDVPVGNLIADDTELTACWGRDVIRVEHGMLHRLEVGPRSSRVFATPTVGSTGPVPPRSLNEGGKGESRP